MTYRVYELFQKELLAVKEEFAKKGTKLAPTMPFFAGRARWARSLKQRIEQPLEVIKMSSVVVAMPWQFCLRDSRI